MIRELVVATKNKKKLEEIRHILKGLNFKITSLADYPKAPRIIENGKTFRENAVKKALKISRFTGKLTLGEDSGICVRALGGEPGVYSSRFAGKGKSDRQNNLKMLSRLGKTPLNKRNAYYSCAVALADAKKLIGAVEGRCYGRIAFQAQGGHGFGYDPLFLISKYKKTFGQLSPAVKHRMSHRFRALKKAKKQLATYLR